MVGHSDKSILRSRKDGPRAEGEGQNSSYTRKKKEKKAKFHSSDDEVTDDVREGDSFQHNHMVDMFVQEVIERAKSEYMSQCLNHRDVSDRPTREPFTEPHNNGAEGTDERLLGDTTPKKDGKDTSKCRRKHHYKYSDPVDEKEISAYEGQEGNPLLHMTSHPDRENSRTNSESRRFYQRTIVTFRRFLGRCLGKT